MSQSRFTAVYVRVSSNVQSHASQEPDLKRWIAVNVPEGEEVRWYYEKYTGTTMQRPRWRDLERSIMAGEVSQLLVWRLDRLGRNAVSVLELLKTLDSINVNFVSMTENIDMKSASGRLMAAMIASFAQYESEVRSERIKAGKARVTPERKAQYKKPGRPKGSVYCDPQILKEIKQHVESGTRIATVARLFHTSPERIYKMIDLYGWDYEYRNPALRRGSWQYKRAKEAAAMKRALRNGHSKKNSQKPAPQDRAAMHFQRLLEEDSAQGYDDIETEPLGPDEADDQE